ncbi:MAG: DNA replication and repair protein RecF [Pseudomonadota bacterium]|nr:DNA replication and repair protein RecF [Pseudomonadota bacterium]
MPVNQVHFYHFRSFSDYQADFSPGCNIIVGPNGSGKTSILEAIYCLAYGKSFRARHIRYLLNHQSDFYQLSANYKHLNIDQTIQLTFQPPQNLDRKLNGTPLASPSILAKMMPAVFIDTGTHRSFAQTPKYRRDFLNWCCFYRFPRYQSAIQRYNRILSQRNHYLKQARVLGQEGLKVWDEPLVYYASIIHEDRLSMLRELQVCLSDMMKTLAPHLPDIHMTYLPGWPQGKVFSDVLSATITQDIQSGFSQNGPHRADLKLEIDKQYSVHKYFSEGQQKLLSYALKLSQLKLLQNFDADAPGLLLVDDLPAELDRRSRHAVLDYLLNANNQCFITGLASQDFPQGQSSTIIELA